MTHSTTTMILLAAATLLCARTANATNQVAARGGSLRQYTSGGHVLGFDSVGYYLSNGTYTLRVRFEGAQAVTPATEDAEQSASSDGKAAALRRVSYMGLWKGVSVTYDAPPGAIARSTWTLEPGADPALIRLVYNSALTLAIDGSVSIAFDTGSLSESRPVAWQEVDGQRQPVEVAFIRLADDRVGFQVGAYRRDLPLIIDPVLIWNTFLGGSGTEVGRTIAVDAGGNVYVAGESTVSWGSPVRAYGTGYDAFVAKLTSDGTLSWNTFLGANPFFGSGSDDFANAIALDAGGDIYVVGGSSGTWGSPLRDHASGFDTFVAKLTSDGALIWNTFLGGGGGDNGSGIAVDGSGNVDVAGHSVSTWGSPLRAHGTGLDAFVAQLTSDGALTWNTFLGGSGTDSGSGIAVDNSDNAYVEGYSDTTWGSPVRAYTAGSDVYAAKLTMDGALIWNTFLGGSGDDSGTDIAVDGSGNVSVAGSSDATWGSPVRAYAAGVDAFAAELTSDGALTWNTFLGGSDYDDAQSIAVSGDGNIYVAGSSGRSWGSPARAYTALGDAFAAKLTADGALTWNTFLGGDAVDLGSGIAVDESGNVYVAGRSLASWGSPMRALTPSGEADAFVVQLPAAPPVCPAVPETGCRTAQKSLLLLKNNADHDAQKLSWKWANGQATTQAELSDPTTSADYNLCIYHAAGFLLGAIVPADAINWTMLGDRGYKYRDRARTANGISRVLLRGNANADKARASIKGRGSSLPDPTLGNLPLPVTTQLHNEQTGICLEDVYVPAPAPWTQVVVMRFEKRVHVRREVSGRERARTVAVSGGTYTLDHRGCVAHSGS